jgi:hypothetical protein
MAVYASSWTALPAKPIPEVLLSNRREQINKVCGTTTYVWATTSRHGELVLLSLSWPGDTVITNYIARQVCAGWISISSNCIRSDLAATCMEYISSHVQTVVSHTAELSKTWRNVMYVLQVSTKRKPGHLLTTCKVQPEKPSWDVTWFIYALPWKQMTITSNKQINLYTHMHEKGTKFFIHSSWWCFASQQLTLLKFMHKKCYIYSFIQGTARLTFNVSTVSSSHSFIQGRARS